MSSVDLRNKVANSGFGNLLNICLELHMSNTGSSDCLKIAEKTNLVSILKQSIEEWDDSYYNFQFFDNAVRNLIETTIEECSEDWVLMKV